MSEIAIIGAGYVGVPLAHTFALAGRSVLLVEVQPDRVEQLNRGESYVEDVPSEVLGELVDKGLIRATTDYDELREAGAILIALPTPLSAQREPDLSIVARRRRETSPRACSRASWSCSSRRPTRARRGSACSRSSRSAGCAPARTSTSRSRPSGSIPAARTGRRRPRRRSSAASPRSAPRRAVELYASALDTVMPVSSPEAAELTKLLENIFRSVNIALVNELALLCDRMGHRHLGGRRRGRHQAVRIHALRARPRASAATAFRRPLLPRRGRRASSTSTPSSSSSRARSTRTCRTSAARMISQALNHGRKRRSRARSVLMLGVALQGRRRATPASRPR